MAPDEARPLRHGRPRIFGQALSPTPGTLDEETHTMSGRSPAHGYPSAADSPDEARPLKLALIAAAGALVSAAAAVITAYNVGGDNAALASIGRASIVAVPIAVGLYVW